MESLLTILAYVLWAVINHQAATAVKQKEPGIDVNPNMYVIGSVLFGGILPLLFLSAKYFLYKNRL